MSRAIYYMILSAFSFSIMNFLIKYLSGFSGFQLVFFRSFGSLFLTVPYLIYHKIPFVGNKKPLLLLRGIMGCLSMFMFFSSVQYLAIGTAVSLRYLSPLFATVIAVVLSSPEITIQGL